MEKIKYLFFKLTYFINYFYYLASSLVKNTYPCKLIGESLQSNSEEPLILYKILGTTKINQINVHELLNDKELIEKFHPIDAMKLGCVAFSNIIFSLPENQRKSKFNEIRNFMLNATHDLAQNPTRNVSPLGNKTSDVKCVDSEKDSCELMKIKNSYSCKLVGGKFLNDVTLIVFTILGRREGHEKSLQEIISNKTLLEKFHPTEAIKFGFIALGEMIFALPKEQREKKLDNLKNNMIH